MSGATITVHITLAGRVQGVGFRESMRAVAQALDITGWVCNREDGTVEATVQGLEGDIEQLIAWCHSGPPGANVKYVNAELAETAETFIAFSRRATY